jgi:outer membrane immunogenic protein
MPLVYDWTGFYIGGHLGAANAQNELIYDDPANFFFGPERFASSHTSFAGGGHVGLQKQWSWIVLGAEAAWTFMEQPEHVRPIVGPDLTLTSRSHSILAVTGKLGWAWDNILAYFKGGYATTEIDYRTSVTSTGVVLSTSSEREHGWTAGAGFEWAVWQHLVFGVEYNYTKFNADRNQFPAGVPPPGTQVDDGGIDIQSVMARLSFKFGGGRPEPMAAK